MKPDQARNPDISVIIITFNNAGTIPFLLVDLTGAPLKLNIEIIVIDNHSIDGTAEAISRYPRVRYIGNTGNMGFAAAVNQGQEIASAGSILLLNPDMRIDYRTIEAMHALLMSDPRLAAVAPRLIYPDGRLQPSRGSFPNLLRTFAHIWGLKHLMPRDEWVLNSPLRILGRVFRQYSPPKKTEYVDYSTGACVIFKHSVLDEVGWLDDRFFLYYEEIDLAYRLHLKGYLWLFAGEFSAIHQVAGSSGQSPLEPFFHRYRSLVMYYRKHKPFWQALLVSLMIFQMTVFRQWAARWISNWRIDPERPFSEERDIYRSIRSFILSTRKKAGHGYRP